MRLRWRARGALGAIARYRVKVGRRSFAMRSSATAKMASQRRTMRLRPGRYRFTATAFDASGRALAKRAGTIKVAKKKHRRGSKRH